MSLSVSLDSSSHAGKVEVFKRSSAEAMETVRTKTLEKRDESVPHLRLGDDFGDRQFHHSGVGLFKLDLLGLEISSGIPLGLVSDRLSVGLV